ncbi:hypothetical protein [Pseudogracilibacillus sp. ICA-222130]|uniref:hypothetical protein n=1 Tax=Pseudogracilibacillus sp. ICA-222130 TaxID=3134655 RepID=UPI0030BB1CF3
MKNKLYYYARGHTAKGMVNYWESNAKDVEDVYVFKHPSLSLTSQLLQDVIAMFDGFGQVEVVMSPFGKNFIEGIIVRDYSIAFMDDYYINREVNLIDFTQGMDQTLLQDIEQLEDSIKQICEKTYEKFEKSLMIHDTLENLFLNEMSFQQADAEINRTITELFSDVQKKKDQAVIYERLFGTKTPDGTTDYVKALIEPLQHRYFIKGRAGTGKSHFMKQIVEQCITYHLDVELYRCSFDPDSIDMIIIRDLQLCMFDSTPPHEFHPTRKEDIVIDLYDIALTPGTDEKYADEIQRIEKAYKQEMKDGVHQLKEIKLVQQQIDNILRLYANKKKEN